MAHHEQRTYLTHHSMHPPVNKFFGFGGEGPLKVLEVGSYDINGSCRDFFNPDKQYEYIGCDVAEGPCVDVVSPAHLLTYEDGYFDFVISCECFEHDMHCENTLLNIVRMLAPKGCFLFSCATTGRAEHGTPRTTPQDSPATQSVSAEWSSYYKNLTEEDIRDVLDVDDIFSQYAFSVNTRPKLWWKRIFRRRASADLYFYGVKK